MDSQNNRFKKVSLQDVYTDIEGQKNKRTAKQTKLYIKLLKDFINSQEPTLHGLGKCEAYTHTPSESGHLHNQ